MSSPGRGAAQGSGAVGGGGGSRQSFRLEPLTPGLGAEVFDLDFGALLAASSSSEAATAVLRDLDEAFLRYKVLMFRGAKLDRETHLGFVRALVRFWGLAEPQTEQQRQMSKDGLLLNLTNPQLRSHPEVYPIDWRQGYGWGRVEQGLVKLLVDEKYWGPPSRWSIGTVVRSGHGNIGGAANVWHSDNMYMEQPSAFTTLRAVRLPPLGGDTMFCNSEQVYDDLDETLKAQLAPLTQVCGLMPVKPHFRREAERLNDWSLHNKLDALLPEPRHPVVRTHPVTGRKVLYVNPTYTHRIEGPGLEELGGSDALKQRLCALLNVPEYQCRFRWKEEGDLLFWDNRCVCHYAVGDYGDAENGGGPRWMEHVATLGTTPVYE